MPNMTKEGLSLIHQLKDDNPIAAWAHGSMALRVARNPGMEAMRRLLLTTRTPSMLTVSGAFTACFCDVIVPGK
jgi:hypothetical protein